MCQVDSGTDTHVWLVHKSGYSPVFMAGVGTTSDKCLVRLGQESIQVEVDKKNIEQVSNLTLPFNITTVYLSYLPIIIVVRNIRNTSSNIDSGPGA